MFVCLFISFSVVKLSAYLILLTNIYVELLMCDMCNEFSAIFDMISTHKCVHITHLYCIYAATAINMVNILHALHTYTLCNEVFTLLTFYFICCEKYLLFIFAFLVCCLSVILLHSMHGTNECINVKMFTF